MLDLLRKKGVESLLDVGCGTGPIYEILKEDNDPMKYKGTDYSFAMIDVCKKNFPFRHILLQHILKRTQTD